MNIWDSVHRGLEKASQEAARIAKIQRLRSIIDNLSQQLNTQQGLVITKAMDLYLSGKLPQGELLTACQQLEATHQHLGQLQNELNQLQTQQNMSGSGNQGSQRGQGTSPNTPNTPDAQATQYIGPDAPSTYAPPPPGYQPFDSAVPPLVPPPPPGIEPNSGQSGQSTEATEAIVDIVAPPPLVESNHCPVCHVALIPGNAFCHNCGSPVAFAADAQQKTVRSGPDTGGNASQPVGENEPPEVMDEY